MVLIGCVRQIPDPDISTHMLGAKDFFAIICSDGVWDVFSSEEAVHFVLAALMRDRSHMPKIAEEYSFVDPCRKPGDVIDGEVLTKAATQLVKAAIERGSTDNCSSIIIAINTAF